ncbi:hypothetical protein EBZ80_24485, partial [bacterium]|nr:hypothetical protein [bacterium]
LVKPGGHLFFIVPDEDLYEQGVFPSRFNPDHKATFTISKTRSWSPRSYNVLDLARSLTGAEIVKLALNDRGYDRFKQQFGRPSGRGARWMVAAYKRFCPFKVPVMERLTARIYGQDQTADPRVSAQIECIVRKQV